VKGNVYKNSMPAENTEVALYKYDVTPGRFLLYSTTLTDANGFYMFDYLPEANYIIKAVTDIAGYVPTFYNSLGGELQWENAEIISTDCFVNPMLFDINLIEQLPQAGTGTISGHVYELEGYAPQAKKAPGDPLSDIDITVDQSPGGAVSSATTDVNGFYEFTVLNKNATFIVRANIPGLVNDSIYTISIDLSVTEYTTLDFWVDSVGVYILADSSTGINNSNLIVEKFEIAPNPASNNINLLLNTTTNSSTTISILNTLGEKVYQIQTNLNAGSNNVLLNINNLANGVYYIQLNDGVHQQTKKLIKQTR
ncbi:MAG: T9SS type A sorting domain-containing protein, partial [Flavobacteriales bacterium]|nr:T9SS type A sorting domain-containing protein [Flavobacteriales bacterium]